MGRRILVGGQEFTGLGMCQLGLGVQEKRLLTGDCLLVDSGGFCGLIDAGGRPRDKGVLVMGRLVGTRRVAHWPGGLELIYNQPQVVIRPGDGLWDNALSIITQTKFTATHC